METRKDFLEKVKLYTYDQTLNELLTNKSNVIDLKLEIKRINEEISRKKANLSIDKKQELLNIKMNINQKKSTRKALKKSTEFPEYVINQKRKQISKEIKALKKEYWIKKHYLSDELEEVLNQIKAKKAVNDLESVKYLINKKNDILKKSKEAQKNIDYDGINKLVANKKEIQNKIKELNKNFSWQNRILKHELVKKYHFNNMADEKKQILSLDKNNQNYSSEREALLNKYVEKYGKSLKYQYSTVSYWLMLLVIVLQIVYIIVFLNDMKINYLEFPVLIINLVITLILFLSAMKVKVHNKKWTYVNFGFSGYLIVRIFAIIPLIAHDYDEVLDEAGEVITQAISYSSLRTVLIVISAIMLGLILISSIISIKRISLREKFMS